jgi:flagellar hook-associated protein 1
MSASALMSIGTRALTANYAALQTTGHNIANANTVGYSRQTVDFETAGGQFSGAGFFGKGVEISTIARAHSEYLTSEAATARSLAAADQSRSTQLQQLEKIFQIGENGLGYAAGQLFNSFADVAAKPQDLSARQVALARADELASRFHAAGSQLDNLQAGVTQDLKLAVKTINGLTTDIAALNQKISESKGAGHEPNDLLDQRDLMIDKLSEYVRVTTVPADDGSTNVFLGGGQALVLGNRSTPLIAVTSIFDSSRLQLAMQLPSGTHTLPDEFIDGGSVAGLLKFQNTDLGDARNLVGQMAAAIAGAVNKQQSLGLDLRTPTGSGAPIFTTGAPLVSPATSNARGAGGVPVASYVDATGTRVPSVGMTIVDSSALRATDYEFSADPSGAPGSYQLKRLSDGDTRSVVDGDVVDGLRINIVGPAPAAGDRFLLSPVGRAAAGMMRTLVDPKGIAAAAPINATVAAGNTGTAAVASVQATSPGLNTNLRATITFTDDVGGYSYSLVDSTGALPTTNGVGTWTAGQPIQLNGWSLQLNGVPRSGDVATVQKTVFPATDNGNANAMIGLRDRTLIGQQTLSDGTVVPGATATDAYANLLADVGVRVQTVKLAAQQSATVATDTKAAVAEKSGVNLDEEAARLIQYQQSYQAAAKMLQVAQSVLQTLLQMGAS